MVRQQALVKRHTSSDYHTIKCHQGGGHITTAVWQTAHQLKSTHIDLCTLSFHRRKIANVTYRGMSFTEVTCYSTHDGTVVWCKHIALAGLPLCACECKERVDTSEAIEDIPTCTHTHTHTCAHTHTHSKGQKESMECASKYY